MTVRLGFSMSPQICFLTTSNHVPRMNPSGRAHFKVATSRKHKRIQMVVNDNLSTRTNTEELTEDKTQLNHQFGFSDPAFLDAVTGEWFGYECEFSVRDGSPNNIPDHYIPDEYRNWGVDIQGFDSLSSTNCSNESLLLKRTRALPSVGCEADAVVPEVSETMYTSVVNNARNGGFRDGSVSCGPSNITDKHSQRWHAILIDSTDAKKSRVRLEHGLVNEPFGAVIVFIEHWDSPFCNGQVLPGCGGSDASFATDKVLDPSRDLVGKWNVESEVYTIQSDGCSLDNHSYSIERTAKDAESEVNVALPRGISVGILCSSSEKCVVAGWLVTDGRRVVIRRKYDASNVLTSVSRDVEMKQV